METKKPEKTIRHSSVKATIWANDGKDGEFFTFTLARVYKTDDGLKDSKSFGWRDVWPLVRTLTSVYSFLAAKNREQKDAERDADYAEQEAHEALQENP